MLAGFSDHGNSISNIIYLFKKLYYFNIFCDQPVYFAFVNPVSLIFEANLRQI